MKPETRYLLDGITPTLFALLMAGYYALAWRGVHTWDVGHLCDLGVVISMQVLLMHAGAFLTGLPFMKTRWAAAGYLAALTGFYGFFTMAIAIAAKSWLPVLVVGGTFAAEVPRVVHLARERELLAEEIPGYEPAFAFTGYLLFTFFVVAAAVARAHPESVGIQGLFKGELAQYGRDGLTFYMALGFFHHLVQAFYIAAGALLGWHRRRRWAATRTQNAFKTYRKRVEYLLSVIWFGTMGTACWVAAFVGKAFSGGALTWAIGFTVIAGACAVPVLRRPKEPHSWLRDGDVIDAGGND